MNGSKSQFGSLHGVGMVSTGSETKFFSIPPLKGHVPALDGLRGLAAIMVVFHHCFIWPMLFSKGIITTDSFRAAYGRKLIPVALWYGYSGVELFFLLSGICLFLPVFSKPHKPYRLKTYAIHRIRRIYPPYLVTVLLAVLLAWFAWAKMNAHLHYATEPVTPRSFFTALTLTEAHFCCTFWSLVVEAQWYFVVPVLALLWRWRRWALHAGMLCTIGVIQLIASFSHRLHLDFLNLSVLVLYLPMFWVGIVIAEVGTSKFGQIREILRRGGWLVLVLLGTFAIYRFSPRPPDWGFSHSQAYPFGVFYAGILSASLFTRFGNRLLSSAWMIKAGSFSYSLYLIHGLVVYVSIVLLDHFHVGGRGELIVCLSLMPAVSVAAGYLFYLLVEKRVQKKKIEVADTNAADLPARDLVTAAVTA